MLALLEGHSDRPQNRIPKALYRAEEGLPGFVTWAMVKEHHSDEEVEGFQAFMHRKTVGLTVQGEEAIWTNDYERWLASTRGEVR